MTSGALTTIMAKMSHAAETRNWGSHPSCQYPKLSPLWIHVAKSDRWEELSLRVNRHCHDDWIAPVLLQ